MFLYEIYIYIFDKPQLYRIQLFAFMKQKKYYIKIYKNAQICYQRGCSNLGCFMFFFFKACVNCEFEFHQYANSKKKFARIISKCYIAIFRKLFPVSVILLLLRSSTISEISRHFHAPHTLSTIFQKNPLLRNFQIETY